MGKLVLAKFSISKSETKLSEGKALISASLEVVSLLVVKPCHITHFTEK